MKHAIVVGGGITGLVAALKLSEQKDLDITVVDAEPSVGGLLRQFDYGPNGKFDFGMHNMLESGIEPLDRMLFGLLPEDEWDVLAGPRRDLAGAFFNGRLQTETPYPDLRYLPPEIWNECAADFFRNLSGNQPAPESENAAAQMQQLFGSAIALKVIDPILRNVFQKSPAELSTFATKIIPLHRVVMFGQPIISDLIKSGPLRQRLAFVDQRDLPLELSSGLKGYYPKYFGMFRVVEALVALLKRAGVKILTGSTINAFEYADDRIIRATLISKGDRQIIDVDRIVWTAGLPVLASTLGVDVKSRPGDPPITTAVINYVVRGDNSLGDLYYAYCYEDDTRTFRITNYSQYCSNAERNGGYPLSQELLLRPEDPRNPVHVLELGRNELHRLGVLKNDAKLVFSEAEILKAGFPSPTLRNMSNMDFYRSKVSDRGLKNLLVAGILSEPNLFFQSQVLADVYEKLERSV